MQTAENPKLDMEEKISLSDHLNRFQYSTAKKSDSFFVDMETFTQGADKDIIANSRIALQRSLSKKGPQRGDKKTNSNTYANDTIVATSPRGSSMSEKPMVVAVGTTDNSINAQVHHQITITTGNIITSTTNTPESRCVTKRNSFKRSSSSWFFDPKRVLLFFATLSSMGTMLLIYFTLSMSKYNADEITLD